MPGGYGQSGSAAQQPTASPSGRRRRGARQASPSGRSGEATSGSGGAVNGGSGSAARAIRSSASRLGSSRSRAAGGFWPSRRVRQPGSGSSATTPRSSSQASASRPEKPRGAVSSPSRSGSLLASSEKPWVCSRCRSRRPRASARRRCLWPLSLHRSSRARAVEASSRALGLEVCSHSSARSIASASGRVPWASRAALWARPPPFFWGESTVSSAPAATASPRPWA